MNLETRIAKLEQLTGAHREGVYCSCTVIVRGVGVPDFYAMHAPCGKPIDREATYHPSIYESRVLYPGMTNREEVFTKPPIEGCSRVFIHDFS